MLRNRSVSTPFSYQTGANTLEPPTKRFRLQESSHSQGFNQDDLDQAYGNKHSIALPVQRTAPYSTVPYGRRSRNRHHRGTLLSNVVHVSTSFSRPLTFRNHYQLSHQALRSMDPPSNTLIIRNLSVSFPRDSPGYIYQCVFSKNKSDPKMVERQFEVHGPVDQFDELISRRGLAFVTYVSFSILWSLGVPLIGAIQYDSGAAQTAFRKMRGSVIDGSIVSVFKCVR